MKQSGWFINPDVNQTFSWTTYYVDYLCRKSLKHIFKIKEKSEKKKEKERKEK